MTLLKYLRKNVGLKVKINAVSGSSFFFCDKISRETPEFIDYLSNDFQEKFKKNVSKLKRQVAKETNNDRKETLKKRLQYNQKALKEFKPMLEREVLETYPSVSYDEIGVEIVVIKGYEKGKFWACREFDRYYKEGKTTSWLKRD